MAQIQKTVEEILKEQIVAVIATMKQMEQPKSIDAKELQEYLESVKARGGDLRAVKASSRLKRIHELAKWAIDHGAEKELYGK